MTGAVGIGTLTPRGKRAWLLGPALALADLRHEWVLTACMTLAVAAVMTPILLLLGLKHGTVEAYRTRLVQDPAFRGLEPLRSREYDARWFERMAQRPDVAYVVPNILRGASSVLLGRPGLERQEFVDLLPTTANDPLIAANGARPPAEGEGVLSFAAAEKLRAAAGDVLEMVIERRAGETVRAALTVAGVLDPRADPIERLYVPFALAEDIETFREGKAVPQRGWTGTTPVPYPSFDRAYLLLPAPLSPADEARLTLGTGFTEGGRIDRAELAAELGLTVPATEAVYRLRVAAGAVQRSSLGTVADQLRGRGALILPQADGAAEITATSAAGSHRHPVAVVGLSPDPEPAERAGLPATPWPAFSSRNAEVSFPSIAQALVPSELDIGDAGTVELRFGNLSAGGSAGVPLRVAGRIDGDRLIVPADLLGMLRTGVDRRVVYDPERRGLVLAKAGNRGFRLYAATIDDVEPLHRALLEEGIDTVAQLGEIRKVAMLDRGLTRLFWLVAVVGIAGGIAAMVSSLYASVQRKRKDLGMMRLMGMRQGAMFCFPMCQGVGIAGMGAALALGAFLALAHVINTSFTLGLPPGSSLCHLPAGHLALASVITVTVAAASSFVAGLFAIRIDPAVALREA
ncbi:putative ABC transport system permease protein [Azospirillum agricola]|uniref:FtsX-like permease family protein n=1 Tax=Azospirillum agricola TaxID=1720247 RepID=UPI001AEB5716|nr:FtsX-like permease family protein [Azospirillum agricola]MBP2227669.1 putative ABC transport system permease protein [Azospirillum agricola]